VANRQEPEFISELTGVEKCLAEVAAAGDLTREARIINIVSFFGSDESANKRDRLESVIPSATTSHDATLVVRSAPANSEFRWKGR
jgi:hypothetical protein